MAHFLDPRYHSSRKQTAMEGDMDWSFFPQYLRTDNYVKDLDYDSHLRDLMMDRRDNNVNQIESNTAPQSTNQIQRRLNIHTYGTANPTDPYTDEQPDLQFRWKDPRGVRDDNIEWDRYISKTKQMISNYDFAPSGNNYGDSGTFPPDIYQSQWNMSKNWLKALMKRFSTGLDTLNPRGLFAHDPTKVARIYYGALNSQDIPIQTTNDARIMSTLIPTDIQYRSDRVPTQDFGMGVYGHGIKSAGQLSLKQEIRGLLSGEIDDQLTRNVTLAPPIINDPTNAVSTILKNEHAIDSILQDQLSARNSRNAWIYNNGNNANNIRGEYTIEPSYDSTKTLLPSVGAVYVTDNDYRRNNVEYEPTNIISSAISSIKSRLNINEKRKIPQSFEDENTKESATVTVRRAEDRAEINRQRLAQEYVDNYSREHFTVPRPAYYGDSRKMVIPSDNISVDVYRNTSSNNTNKSSCTRKIRGNIITKDSSVVDTHFVSKNNNIIGNNVKLRGSILSDIIPNDDGFIEQRVTYAHK